MTPRHSLPFHSIPLIVASFILVVGLDCVSGRYAPMSWAYILPVYLTAQRFEISAVFSVGILNALAAGIVFSVNRDPATSAITSFWTAFTCLMLSLITGAAFYRLRLALAKQKSVNAELQNALAHLEGSTTGIRELQDGMQIVCAWTNRIKVGEEWLSPDEFMSSQLQMKLSHGMSPDAFEEMNRELIANLKKMQTTPA